MAKTGPGGEEWRQRQMKGGVWVDPVVPTSRPRAEKTVSVKMTEAELAEFDAQIARAGIKRNRALRIAARRIGGFLEADEAVTSELREISRQITGIAKNVNQIARAANRTRDPDYIGFLEERRALGTEIARFEAQAQTILDLAARREDGLARLEAAARE